MCISRSFGDLITALTLIPTEFLTMHFVLRQKPMKNHLFSVLSGDERRGTPAGDSLIVYCELIVDSTVPKFVPER